MPLYNQVGEPMPMRTYTPSEWEKLLFLRKLKFPEDKKYIFHLSPKDLETWIYSLEPRESLLLMSTSGIKQTIQRKLNPWRFSLVTDFLWRLFH